MQKDSLPELLYSKVPHYSPNDLWYLFEERNPHMEENIFYGLEVAIKHIKAGITDELMESPCQGYCFKVVRDVTVQLLMLSWGYYGPSEMTAGYYLASHREEIGQYFSNSMNNQWPYHPLHNGPNELEVKLNDILKSLTKKLSKEKIIDVSILDLPAFGSKRTYLEDLQINDPNWENEINFQFLNTSSSNMSKGFKEYKEISHAWSQYVSEMNEKQPTSLHNFPPNMMANPFNYSKFIFQDLSTFMKISSGSHTTASRQTTSTWKGLANSFFKQTINDGVVENKGMFDKNILKCSFKKKVAKTTQKKLAISSGCEIFQQSLTNNGLCYTFNGLKSINVWRPSKLTETFHRVLNSESSQMQQNYAGVGTTEGKFL